jgi:ParB/RepB/Spo0J family partition protein
MFELVEIDRLVGASDNLRRNVGNVTELAASIRSIGVLEPLLVTPAADGFAVVAGHRRLAAARKAGLDVVPCVVREMSEVERVIAMVVENEQRSDLSPIESAEGYFRLIDMGITQKELAKKVGRSAKHVASRLALLELPRTVRRQVHAGRLGLGAAAALLELVDEPQVIEEIAAGDPADVERAVLRHQARSAQRAEQLGHDESDVEDPEEELQVGRDGDDGEAEAAESEWQRRARERSEAEAARRRSLSEARTARGEFVVGLVQRRLPKGDVSAHVAATIIETMSAAQARLACRMLAVEPLPGTFGPDYRTPLLDHASSSVGNRDRVVLAVCLAKGEEAARAGYPSPLGYGYVEFLATFGYEPTAGDPERPAGDEVGRSSDAA